MTSWMPPTMGGMPPITDQQREELEAFIGDRLNQVMNTGIAWGHFYELEANTVPLFNRPDFWDLTRRGRRAFINRLSEHSIETEDAVELSVESFGHLAMYVLYGWETGIYNEFRHMQSRGFTKAQLMEIVLFAQLVSGIRGLQVVYNAVGKLLVDFRDPEGPPPLPQGWEPDPDAFKAGLDLSVRALTDQDRKNIEDWYTGLIGYVPASVEFAMTFHPEFYKWHRARWEVIFQTLPKQVMPYIMMRQQMIAGNADALREAVLLAKAWGMQREWVIQGLTVSAWYTGFEGLYTAKQAADDILRDWQ